MKITDISWIHSGRAVYVKIETDKDITGYGEATNFAPRSVIGLIEEIRPYLLGEDPRRIEHLWQESFRRLFARGGPITGSALAGIDMALWDIKGKELDTPVYELLGGLARTRVRLYGHVTGHSAEEIAANAKRLADRGVTAIRYRGFHDMDAKGLHDHQRAVRQQVEYTEAIRSAVGDDVDLIIECHGRYDPDHAVQLARQVAEFNPLTSRTRYDTRIPRRSDISAATPEFRSRPVSGATASGTSASSSSTVWSTTCAPTSAGRRGSPR